MGIVREKSFISVPTVWSDTIEASVAPITDVLDDILLVATSIKTLSDSLLAASNSLIATTESILAEVPLLLLPQVDEGGQTKVWVKDDGSMAFMEKSLVELKKMNLYLSGISDMEVSDKDVEQGG